MLGLLATACADFVNIIPKDLVTEDNFWDEKADVDQMISGVYYKMQSDGMMRRYIVWGELRSDNIYMGMETAKRDASAYEVLRENILSTNAYTTWMEFYNIINTCNQIVEMAPVVGEKDPTYTPSNVNATIAEAVAIRSLMYFYLIRTFGDVPFYTKAVKYEDNAVDLPVTSFDEVLTAIINDCESVLPNAIKVYPTTSTYNENTGRITQDAIHALLADMYLWKGDYKKVVSHSDAVIESFCYNATYGKKSQMSSSLLTMLSYTDDPGVTYPSGKFYRGYPLYYDGGTSSSSNYYGEAFNIIFGQNGGSKETIFELYFCPEDGTAYRANEACGFFFGEQKPKDSNKGEGALAPNKRMYENNATTFWTASDARRYCSMEVDKEGSTGWIRKFASAYNEIDATKASSDNSIAELNVANSYTCSSSQNYNWIFYRLADVMLMKAEALVEQMIEKPTTKADSAYNEELRQPAFYLAATLNMRSCMVSSKYLQIADQSYQSKSGMQDLVQTERRKELMFEGKRWFDLVRYARRKGTIKDLAAAVKPKFDSGTGSSVLPNMESLFWPYNKEEVKRNTLLEQKPYWNSLEGSETTQTTL